MPLPPAPVNEPAGSFAWQQWYIELQRQLGGTEGAIAWDVVSKDGSNLTEIATRDHNNLQSIQGGNTGTYYHLIKATKSSKVHDFASIAAGAQESTTQAVAGADTTDVVVLGFSSTP